VSYALSTGRVRNRLWAKRPENLGSNRCGFWRSPGIIPSRPARGQSGRIVYLVHSPSSCPSSTKQCRREEGGGKPVQKPGRGCPEGGPGLHFVAICVAFLGSIIICPFKFNPCTPSPSHSATASQFFRFSVTIFNRSALAGAGAKIFSRGARTSCRRLCNKVCSCICSTLMPSCNGS
jgi:hypothetical protein